LRANPGRLSGWAVRLRADPVGARGAPDGLGLGASKLHLITAAVGMIPAATQGPLKMTGTRACRGKWVAPKRAPCSVARNRP
jgi:hypothetical protein